MGRGDTERDVMPTNFKLCQNCWVKMESLHQPQFRNQQKTVWANGLGVV